MVRLRVAKGDKIYTVFLSPWWFYFKLNPNLKIGDSVEIKGAKIYTRRHGLALVVKTLKNLSTGEELILRDTTCKPLLEGREKLKKAILIILKIIELKFIVKGSKGYSQFFSSLLFITSCFLKSL